MIAQFPQGRSGVSPTPGTPEISSGLPGSYFRVLTSKQSVLFPLKENGGKEVLSEVVLIFEVTVFSL